MRIITLLFSLLMAFSTVAQTCNTSIAPTSPSDNFTDNEDGTVTDTSTGLMWMKCSIGQTYDTTADTCTGAATDLTWQETLQLSRGYSFANYSDWRVPNVKELITITEKSCVRPSINAAIFPNTTSDNYWSSTPSEVQLDSAWVVAFFNSSNSLRTKDSFVFARYVRFAN